MKTLPLVGLLVVAVAGTAHADVDGGDRYVGAGGSVAADDWLYAGGFLEGGVRMPGHRIWVHGRLEHAGATDFEAGGEVTAGMVGVEGRDCITSGRVCAVLGVDLGYLTGTLVHESWDEGKDDHVISAALMELRGGVELVVARHVGLRLGLSGRRLIGDAGNGEGATGIGGNLGIIVRW